MKNLILFTLTLYGIVVFGFNFDRSSFDEADNWDILVFTQHWPAAVCHEWMHKSKNNKCNFAKSKDLWTIHGIWPTKIGKIGPEACNTTWKFDPTKLEPLMDDLDTFWTNIESNTPKTSFWKHEWEKHGTCAAELEEFNSEYKYFGKGLSWLKKYEMKNILSNSNIVPNPAQGYYVENIHNAIKKVTQKNPTIQCVREKDLINKKNISIAFFTEIRICFNKDLDIIDCDGIRDPYEHVPHEEIITNCNLNEPIIYIDDAPKPPTTPKMFYKNSIEAEYDDDEIFMMHDESPDERAKRQELVKNALEMYNFVNFLRWMTL